MTTPYTILHLGLGSFHRAHEAWYLQRLHDSGDRSWRLVAGNLRNDQPELMAALEAQHGVYTLELASPAGAMQYQRISAIAQVIRWTPDLAGLIAAAADPATRIISFTVTEAGYFLDPALRLDTAHPDVAADLHGGFNTIYGALTAMLRARRAAQAGGLTLLCCDNVRGNGERFHLGLAGFLTALGDTDLLAWIDTHTRCPNAMVDRITPRPLPAVRARVQAALGIDDPCALMGETFAQWVVEEHFAAGRPDWERVGVEMVDSVVPYEEAKIRILNAQHSCIAWAGALRGYTWIHEGTLDAQIRGWSHDYVTHDVIPCLTPSPVDLAAYRDTVLERFSNAWIQDTNQRVAADGFAKIPSFIAPTLHEQHAAGRTLFHTARLPALFLLFLQARAQGRIPFDYQDQAMNEALVTEILGAADPVARLAAETSLFGALAGQAVLAQALRAAYDDVRHAYPESAQ
ncbi:MAG: mannitol dehydrogenase family protein [Pseudomonadota bacterium]|nr:mannitol dehydrogenase family protein [Pseudomonadota bacterium]